MPRATGPACECAGMVPPPTLPLQLGAQPEVTEDTLLSSWNRCGRCGHSLRCHGYLDLDPWEEQVRRTKVAIRMDELLEVRWRAADLQDMGKLLDFHYHDPDLASLRRQMPSLAYVRTKAAMPPSRNQKKKDKKNGTATGPSRTIVHADIFQTLNFMLQRAFQMEWQACVRGSGPGGQHCMKELFSLARRSVIRLDPSVKHSVCSRCKRPCLEGLNSHTTIRRAYLSTDASHKAPLFCSDKMCGLPL